MKKKMLFFILLQCFNFNTHLLAQHFLTYIIPCYNSESWIEQAIASIYEQDINCPFEIICTDDCSKDGTFDLLNDLSKLHPEIVLLRHSTNQGGGAARNTCVSHSKGDIIFCLDSDNVLAPNTVQRLINRMDETRCDIVSCGTLKYFVEDFKLVGTLDYYTPNQFYTLNDILTYENSPAWSGNYLYTRSSYDRAGGYPTQWGALDTFTFGFNQLLHHCTLTYVPGTYYWHRHGIESYYIREAKAKRINIHFFDFMLSQGDLFSNLTIFYLQIEKAKAKKGEDFLDMTCFLRDKLLQLRIQ